MKKFMYSKVFLKIYFFISIFKGFYNIFQKSYWDNIPFSDTCLKFMAIVRETAICFFGRNTPNNKFLNVTNKETNKVMCYRCWCPFVMNLELLTFTWKQPQLASALFASSILSEFDKVIFGVPQYSFVGPILFNCFFNDYY